MSDSETNSQNDLEQNEKDNDNNSTPIRKMKRDKKNRPYVWAEARKEAFSRMLEIKKLKDSNKKLKRKEDNEIKKQILKTTRKQLKEKVKKLNVDGLKSKVNLEDELIEETAKQVIKPKHNHKYKYEPEPDIIEDEDTAESSYESD